MHTKSSICWLAVALLSGAFSIANAQSIDSLRTVKRLATETFLDSSKPTTDRLEAATKLRYPEAETFPELLRVGTDTTDDDSVRLVALKRCRYDDKYIDAVLTIIANLTESELLAAGLIEDITRRTTFRQPAALRQRLQGALRDRLSDPRDAVRLWAYRALVASHDQMAIDKLVESLRSGVGIPVPLPEAIDLLDIDGSAKHIVTLRPYLDNPDPAVRAQAARALAVDPESRPAIVNLASNIETPEAVRIKALRALSREDERFVDYAVKLMGNSKEVPDIRYEAMKAAMGRLNYHGEPNTTQINFALAVERLASEQGLITADGRDVGVEAKKLIPHLRKSFPAVRKYFERRRQ